MADKNNFAEELYKNTDRRASYKPSLYSGR